MKYYCEWRIASSESERRQASSGVGPGYSPGSGRRLACQRCNRAGDLDVIHRNSVELVEDLACVGCHHLGDHRRLVSRTPRQVGPTFDRELHRTRAESSTPVTESMAT